jgi:hypothetical protein
LGFDLAWLPLHLFRNLIAQHHLILSENEINLQKASLDKAQSFQKMNKAQNTAMKPSHEQTQPHTQRS